MILSEDHTYTALCFLSFSSFISAPVLLVLFKNKANKENVVASFMGKKHGNGMGKQSTKMVSQMCKTNLANTSIEQKERKNNREESSLTLRSPDRRLGKEVD